MKIIGILLALLVLASTGVFAASITGTTKALGGGNDTVPHCQVQQYDIPASDTISSINVRVECDITGTYTVDVTVTSGASSGSGQNTGVSLTADTPSTVGITIAPTVAIGSSTYDADITVTR